MAATLKVLGQLNPGATTLTTLYTVPAATQTVCSSLVVCNQANAGRTFRISVRVAGAADNAKQYLFYDTAVAANASNTYVLGISLAATDVVSVYASNTDLSFNLFGQENT